MTRSVPIAFSAADQTSNWLALVPESPHLAAAARPAYLFVAGDFDGTIKIRIKPAEDADADDTNAVDTDDQFTISGGGGYFPLTYHGPFKIQAYCVTRNSGSAAGSLGND